MTSSSSPTECKCDGRCCAVFYFPSTPEQIRERGDSYEDGAYIADMLIPLTVEQTKERMKRFGMDGKVVEGKQYTCRHWDEDTKLCGAYDRRPEMCRHYPYGVECQHGCGFKLPQAGIEAYELWRNDKRPDRDRT